MYREINFGKQIKASFKSTNVKTEVPVLHFIPRVCCKSHKAVTLAHTLVKIPPSQINLPC